MSQPTTDQIATTLTRWLAIDSTSGTEREFLERLEQMFRDDDWGVTRQPVQPDRWNLVVDDGTAADVMLCTHVDTVPPHLPVRREGDTIYGRGACDTKGGLVAMVHAARRLRAAGNSGIGFLLVVGEEVDHIGAKVARQLEVDPGRIILCEPTRNQVVEAQKGMLRFTLRAEGVAGHSAYPDDGVSAIESLLDALEALRTHPWPDDELLGTTTLNIGVLEGGVAANVFAPDARAEVLFRATTAVEPLLERVEALTGDDVELVEPVYNDPVFFDPPDGVPTCTVPFNTDAPYLTDIAPVWLAGPGDIRCAHSRDEHICLDEIFDGIELYEQLMRQALQSEH